MKIHTGDSLLILPTLPEASIDSCVTDPPYELTQAKRNRPPPTAPGPFSRHRVGVNGDNRPVGGFMGKEWDGTGIAFNVELWKAVLRALKPGAHLLAFSGTRTYHRMVCAIEDAGFEIRDQLAWVYGQGFPKSHNLDGEWKGWGTALKPAWEPIVLARKPLIGTVASNVQAHGTGAVNIDGCRVEGAGAKKWVTPRGGIWQTDAPARSEIVDNLKGRWPANLIHDGSDEVMECFPDAPGQLGDLKGHSKARTSRVVFGDMKAPRDALARRDVGSAARFFYCAKASKADREAGLREAGLREAATTDGRTTPIDNPYLRGETQRLNTHPTVKPTALMRWLCRLVTPPGGTVLDPFLGSGSTGRACVLEGFDFVGVERELEYVKIAEARIAAAQVEVPLAQAA